MDKLICVFAFLILFSRCVCNEDEITRYEGRVLTDIELNLVPYKNGDSVNFISDNIVYTFKCINKKREYHSGSPYYKDDKYPCDGQILRSYDYAYTALKTPLSAYLGSANNGGIVRKDSIQIGIINDTETRAEGCSIFKINTTGHSFGVFANPSNNSTLFFSEENCNGSNANYFPFQSVNQFDSLLLNGNLYFDVLCFVKEPLPSTLEYPYYFEKFYYNATNGIIRLDRSDGKVYDLLK